MRSETITWENIHLHGSLWWQHHCLRKRLFVDQMQWSIPHCDKTEWDQYDTGQTVYVITHENGRAVAASRLNRCDFESCGWSYMIRDAQHGKLPGIPQDVCAAPPIDKDTYEATRFTVDPHLSREDRNTALSRNAIDLSIAARELGANRLIALMPPAYARWLRSLGLDCNRFGPTVRTGDGAKACVLEMHLHREPKQNAVTTLPTSPMAKSA